MAKFSSFLSSLETEKDQNKKCHVFSMKFYESMEKALSKALVENQFELYYQPFICFNTRKIVAVEALIRWNHPHWGLISPDKFIPIAEKSGLIFPLGEWIIREACSDIQEFLSYPLKLAINISPHQLQDTFFLRNMIKILQETKFYPQNLSLEITEGIFLENSTNVIKLMVKLKKMGISLALDDFGTGYAGLEYLNDFPFDVIKLDKSFIHNIARKSRQKSIVNSMVTLAKTLNLTVHVEGIENNDDLNWIISEGINQGQGYFFCPPLSINQLKSFLKIWVYL
ncbi:putative bifunctional diguanylate cyclase/phosphodiesterase [Cyanobacterium aponinum]|nr:EAL domain-containing protein [Cyanobacterium aponinum]